MSEFTPLDTKRLILRRITLNDAPDLFAYRSLPEVALYQSWKPDTLAEAERFILNTLKSEPGEADSWIQLAVCLKEGTLIGDIGIHYLSPQQIELGYTLNPHYQKQGYAYEALSALIDRLFIQDHNHRMTASADPDNLSSIRLLVKLGFRKEAHFKKSFYLNGQWYDDVLYAILEEEWILRKR